jgi:hypothetical protein
MLKKIFSITLISFLILTNYSSASETYKLYGHFLKLDKSDNRNVYKHDYYFHFKNRDGRSMAYPVVIKDANFINQIEKNKASDFYIEANAEKEYLPLGEMNQKVEIVKLELQSLKNINLAELSFHPVKGYKTTASNIKMNQKKSVKDVPTISGLNDNATNAVIFTMGAALLGTMILAK